MQPFSVFLRSDRPHYYVAFKNEDTGRYLSAISTKKTNKNDAYKQAWLWYKEGIPRKKEVVDIKHLSLLDTFRRADLTTSDVECIVEELKRRGLLVSAVFPNAPDSVRLVDYLKEFWDFELSPYIREKLRKEHSIHKRYANQMLLCVKKYWVPFFSKKLLGDLRNDDIENFMEYLSEYRYKKGNNFYALSHLRKNNILKAGAIALRWAYRKGKINRDITRGMILFSGKTAERKILKPEMASSIFSQKWYDSRAMVANMTAMVTGLRAGELQGLLYEDIKEDSLFVRHSWNYNDKLKTTKNNESRIVEVPFPHVLDSLRNIAESNPHGVSKKSYVFWSSRSYHRPMEQYTFLLGLRAALVNSGLTEQEAADIDFHSWRHFFTTYLRDKLDDRLLQSQTGHKSLPMLDRYSAHRKSGDRDKIIKAQKEVFSAFLPHTPCVDTAIFE